MSVRPILTIVGPNTLVTPREEKREGLEDGLFSVTFRWAEHGMSDTVPNLTFTDALQLIQDNFEHPDGQTVIFAGIERQE